MSTSSAWRLEPSANAYRLVRTQRPIPQPGPGEIVVRIRAVSLNYRDLINRGNTAGRDVAGRIPCSDGAGEIVQVGRDVTQWHVGDRVAGCFFQGWQSGPFDLAYHKTDLGGTIDGVLAEHVLFPADGCVAIPPHLSCTEASTLPCAALTAWTALMTRGNLQADQTVLVLGTGGVSIFGLQIASAVGAKVVVTSSSHEKLIRAHELGAAKTINYREVAAWDHAVWEWTGKRGVDHVLEVGGPGTLEKSLGSVAAGGQIALIGVLTGFGAPPSSLFPLIARNARLNGIYVGSRQDFQAMNAFFQAHQIRPVLDRVFPFSAAEEAYNYLESGQHFGKVVIAADRE